ncbi:hypothetical protein TWF718_007727 [Orbilia javanica]|uniref:Terpene synthase n=1 Tax=Orbilia javanica TaxID=47235 RepID=A0AAN8MVR4_9PEZI
MESRGSNIQIQDEELLLKLPTIFHPCFHPVRGLNRNRYYTKAKSIERAEWVSKAFGFSAEAKKKFTDADFPLVAAYWAPDASEDRYWTVVDFMDWVFIFDDQFDEGHLCGDYMAAVSGALSTLAIFEENTAPITIEQDPLNYLFQRLWNAIKAARFKEGTREYLMGLIHEVFSTRISEPEKDPYGASAIDQFLVHRKRAVGGWADGIQIPESVSRHPLIVELREIATTAMAIHNDILSATKEMHIDFPINSKAEGEESNIVIKYWLQGYSMQEAIDESGKRLYDSYDQWQSKLAELRALALKWDQETREELRMWTVWVRFPGSQWAIRHNEDSYEHRSNGREDI